MARYKHYDLNQTKMIPLSYADQVVQGSFEHALNEIEGQQGQLADMQSRQGAHGNLLVRREPKRFIETDSDVTPPPESRLTRQ